MSAHFLPNERHSVLLSLRRRCLFYSGTTRRSVQVARPSRFGENQIRIFKSHSIVKLLELTQSHKRLSRPIGIKCTHFNVIIIYFSWIARLVWVGVCESVCAGELRDTENEWKWNRLSASVDSVSMGGQDRREKGSGDGEKRPRKRSKWAQPGEGGRSEAILFNESKWLKKIDWLLLTRIVWLFFIRRSPLRFLYLRTQTHPSLPILSPSSSSSFSFF